MTLPLVELASVVLGVVIGRYAWTVISAILLTVTGIGAVYLMIIGVAVLGVATSLVGVFIALFVLTVVLVGLVLLLPFAAGVAAGIALRRHAGIDRALSESPRRRAVALHSRERGGATALGPPAPTADPREELLALLAARAARARGGDNGPTAIVASGGLPVDVAVSR
jgi:hypothetical protein